MCLPFCGGSRGWWGRGDGRPGGWLYGRWAPSSRGWGPARGRTGEWCVPLPGSRGLGSRMERARGRLWEGVLRAIGREGDGVMVLLLVVFVVVVVVRRLADGVSDGSDGFDPSSGWLSTAAVVV